MPLYTKNYNLTAFTWGEIYSSFEDRNRFSIIDNQMDFISRKVGNGVIHGWNIIEDSGGGVNILDGIGIIDNSVVSSFGGYSVDLDKDSVHYIYVKKRDITGGVSGGSNISYVTAVNEGPPSAPINVERVLDLVDYIANLNSYNEDLILYLKSIMDLSTLDESEILGYSQIAFKWGKNEDFDFSHYIIKRSLDSSLFENIFETERNIYVDINLEQNTEYYYQIFAVDKSGNVSDPLEFSFSTEKDKRIPLAPLNLQLFAGKNSLQAIWSGSPSDNVVGYRVVLKEDSEIKKIEHIQLSDDNFYNYTFKNLEENIVYSVYVYSLSQYIIDEENYEDSSYVVLDERVVYSEDAGEIDNFNIYFFKSSVERVAIEADITWDFKMGDSSALYPSKFVLVTIDDMERFSWPIEILESDAKNILKDSDSPYDYKYNLRYIPYYDEQTNKIVYETIKEFSSYRFILQTVDENDVVSYGKIKKIDRTPISKDVSSVSEFSLRRNNNNSLFMQWKNPIEEYFSYNLITISIDGIEEPIINNKNIGKANSFVLSSDYFDVNYRYHINICSYDFFNNFGNEFEYIKLFDIDEIDRVLPDEINNLSISRGDKSLTLYWIYDLDANNEVVSFNVYRANYNFYLSLEDFSLIATLPSSENKLIDYDVENGNTYTYFVSSVDIHGEESFIFEKDSYLPSKSVSGTPSVMFPLTSPSNLSVVRSGVDFHLEWEQEYGSFDGYQILRSFRDKYSFEVVGYCSSFENQYVDNNASLVNGENYYYMIRKFLNEVDLEISKELIYSHEYLFIGEVESSNGKDVISIDMTGVRNILNFEDPIKEIVDERINNHNHRLERGRDKRIELRSNVSIQDWITNDYISYQTQQDLSYVENFTLRINGQINEEYFKDSKGHVDFSSLQRAILGSSPVIFSLDKKNNRIIFNSSLYSDCIPSVESNVKCPSVPYLTAPSISLELLNISEVDNYLPSEKLENISASQINTGILDISQIPQIEHEGRIGEKLLPLKLKMWSQDNFQYSLFNEYSGDRNRLGDSVTFYDILKINNNFIIAATSNGVWGSNDFGNSWEQLGYFKTAPHKLYKSSYDKIYVLTNYGIYTNDGFSYRSWNRMEGMEEVKIIRDITEDDEGNLYASTNLGVFKFNKKNVPYIEDKWQRLDIYGPRSSESYAIFYKDGELLVSNEIIFLKSDDYGNSWEIESSSVTMGKVWDIKEGNNCIFSLGENSLYRKKDGENYFIKVKDFEGVACRKIEIFNNRIFVSTNSGVFSSASNIYDNDFINFVKSLGGLDINGIVVPATCLKTIDENYLFVGADRRLLMMDNESKVWEQYSQKNTVIPTFYINSEEIKLGVYYDNNTVYFDDRVGGEDVVEVSNKYDIYYAENGGWVFNKYDSKFIVYKNYNKLAESRDIIDIDVSEFSNIQFPEYNDLNSHKIKADEYKNILGDKIEFITLNYSIISRDEKNILVKEIYDYFEKFLSQIYSDYRIILDDDGSFSNFILPPIETDLINKIVVTNDFGERVEKEIPLYNNIENENYSTKVNIVDGRFVFDLPFDKYDVLSLDVKGVSVKNIGDFSHRGLEDSVEYIYSGFTSYLSQVQQINLLKLGMFNEKMWPGYQNIYNPLINTKIVIPRDYSHFDSFNSTFNFSLHEYSEDENFYIDCPSTVKYIPFIGKIYVGGWEGVLSIDKNNLFISKLNLGNIDGQMIRDIHVFDNIIYIVSSKNIFHSQDGENWEAYDTSGLPNNLYAMSDIRGNLVIGGEDGIYVKSPYLNVNWSKTINSDSPVSIIFSSNVLFSVVNKNIHISSNGYSFKNTGIGEDIKLTNMVRFENMYVYMSSISGFYFDSGSFNSTLNRLVEIDMGDFFDKNEDTINDVATDNNIVVIGVSNGSYGVIEDDVLRIKEYSLLPTIHKVLIVDGDIWLFGGGLLNVPDADYPIKLVEGVPL